MEFTGVITMKCSYCGRETDGFACTKCGKRYCSAHRMSSQHDCQGVGGASSSSQMKMLNNRVNDSIFWADKDNPARHKKD